MSSRSIGRVKGAAVAGLLVLSAVAVGVAVAAPAGAVSTCTFDKAHATVNVDYTTGAVMTAPGGTIELGGVPCTAAGGAAATVNNTDTINVTGDATPQVFTIGLALGPFAPGKTNEPGHSDEIEWTVDLGPGADILSVSGDDAANAIQFSASGVNLNASETTVDTDVTFSNVESGVVFGDVFDDVVDATGFTGDMTIYGSSGVDTITGGSGPDRLYGQDGNDVINGGPGNDTIDDGLGDDTVNGDAGDDGLYMGDTANGADAVAGGSGTDAALYYGRTKKVTVVLDNAANDGDASANGGLGEQDNVSTDVENVYSGTGADRLTGSGGVNILNGGGGNDQINGKSGEDILQGGDGNDTFVAKDGVKDVVEGDAGTDSCTCDAIDQQIDIP
jgi:Ca2+-binding RTX toxin-like protein